MIIRNGWFSYRWREILEKGKIASSTTVMVARRTDTGGNNQMAPFAPVPVDEVVATRAAAMWRGARL
jgi:aspartate aminotransferase-like enzyme